MSLLGAAHDRAPGVQISTEVTMSQHIERLSAQAAPFPANRRCGGFYASADQLL